VPELFSLPVGKNVAVEIGDDLFDPLVAGPNLNITVEIHPP
jgi:hypothetical protein